MRNGMELILVKDISMFLGFANFYWQFIKEFGKIVVLFSIILEIMNNRRKTSACEKSND